MPLCSATRGTCLGRARAMRLCQALALVLAWAGAQGTAEAQYVPYGPFEVYPGQVFREGPGVHRKVVFAVQGGSRLRVSERGAGWARVRLPGGLEGWAPLADLGELNAPPRHLRNP